MNATNTGAGPANDEQLDGYRLLFGLVGKLLYLYPQQDFIDGLLRDEAFLDWPLVEDDPTFAEGVSLLRDWNERYRAGLDDEAAGALRTDATRLFAGLQTMAVPPWESVYFNKERMIFLNEACRAALDDWLEERSRQAAADPNALFLTRTHTRMTKDAVHYMVKQRLKKAGLDASLYSSHKLRHTAATLMLQNGVDVRTLQEVLGHENLNTTQIYTHVDNENLRSAAKANPLGRMKKKSTPIPPGK